MSRPPVPPAATSPRPTSTGSYFADSAISMDPATPPPLKSLPPLDALYSTSSGLFERLNRIAAAAWDAEQDGRLTESNVDTLHAQLDSVESRIAGTEAVPLGGPLTPRKTQLEPPETLSAPSSFSTDLESVSTDLLATLRTTVSSLRLRHAEHRHLLSLSTSRLEALAQRCIAQDRAIQSLTRELRDLRNENNALGRENGDGQAEIEALKAENASKDLAMEAMAGAVSGLEGWIESTVRLPTDAEMTGTNRGGLRRSKRREVIRGRGRFRGRYYVDEYEPGSHHNGEADVRDLHDGIRAWLRGFRDVEEGLRARGETAQRRKVDGNGSVEDGVVEDEWGDFESAA